MPDSYAESAEGTILVANGIDPVIRWDGQSSLAAPAGVVAPVAGMYGPILETSTALWIYGSETVTIDGVSYQRKLDANGHPPGYNYATGVIDRPYDGVLYTAVNGLAGVGETGPYYAYVRYVDDRGNLSDLSPLVGVNVLLANGGSVGIVAYANVPSPLDQKVRRRQILRNTSGQTRTFYVAIDTEDLASPFFVDALSDDQLATQEAVPILDTDLSPLANRYAPPPSTKPFLAFHLQRMWLGGIAAYAEGGVQVANGSATVTGLATRWPSTFVGRFLYVLGSTRSYEIASVNTEAQTLTLTEAYTDATDAFAQYAIKPPPGEAQSLRFSEPGLPEAWPVFNAFTLPVDGDEDTGLLEFGSFLYVLKRRRMYKMTAQSDPGVDGFIFYSLGRGCINHRSWVIVEEQVYLLDEGASTGSRAAARPRTCPRRSRTCSAGTATGRSTGLRRGSSTATTTRSRRPSAGSWP
jgi:hypothetical protein